MQLETILEAVPRGTLFRADELYEMVTGDPHPDTAQPDTGAETDPFSDFYTVDDLARHFGRGRATVRSWMREIPGARKGPTGEWVVSGADFTKWFTGQVQDDVVDLNEIEKRNLQR